MPNDGFGKILGLEADGIKHGASRRTVRTVIQNTRIRTQRILFHQAGSVAEKGGRARWGKCKVQSCAKSLTAPLDFASNTPGSTNLIKGNQIMAKKSKSTLAGGSLKQRLTAILHQLELETKYINAAQRLAKPGGDYWDFFVENNNGGLFHEKSPSDPFLGIEVAKEKFSQARLRGLDRAKADDPYPDFFVEGSGPPWHERIDAFGIRNQLVTPAQRAFALRRSNVI